MSISGSGGKRVRMSPTDAENSPKRPNNRRGYSRSRSPSPSLSRSPSPSPYRSPSPSPCRSWSQRQPSYDDADDQLRSRSRGSEEMDRHGRPVWRPHSYKELGEEGRGVGGEYSVRIGDYDRLFTCRSCHRMLSSPVYQCAAAHVTCSRCHGEVGDNRCSFCGSANGYARCRAVEEFLYRIGFSCRNQEYGCEAFLPQHEMRAHERSCRHEPCFCPVPRCGFAGPTYALEVHLANLHRWDVVNFRYGESFQAPAHVPAIFRCEDRGELFHINSCRESCGTALSMICIRPDNACKQEFTYQLKLPAAGGANVRHRLQMQSTVWNTSLRYGIGEGSNVFLMVPDKLPGSGSGCAVEVCIHKVAAGATSD